MKRTHVYVEQVEGICDSDWIYKLKLPQLINNKLADLELSCKCIELNLTHCYDFILLEDFVHKTDKFNVLAALLIKKNQSRHPLFVLRNASFFQS